MKAVITMLTVLILVLIVGAIILLIFGKFLSEFVSKALADIFAGTALP